MLTDLAVVTKAEVTKIVEWGMVKINDKIKAKGAKTVADTFEEAIQTIYSKTNESLKSALYNVVEHAFTDGVRAGRDHLFDKTQRPFSYNPSR